MTDQTPIDPLPQEQVDTLVSIFMSGFVSGITTLVARGGTLTPDLAHHLALGMADLVMTDPAFRLELGTDLTRFWTDPGFKESPLRVFNAYVTMPRNGGGHP